MYRRLLCVSIKLHGCFLESIIQTSLGSFSTRAFNLFNFLYDTVFQMSLCRFLMLYKPTATKNN